MNTRRFYRRFLSVACLWAAFSLGEAGSSPLAWAQQGETAEDTYRYDPVGKRDPFVSPFYVPPQQEEPQELRTPLQRFELGQLKLVGVIWETEQPKALIEDSGGLGYVVTAGTLIGSKGGVIIAIEPRRIVIEEYETDFYGKRQRQERELQLSIIDSTAESRLGGQRQ